MSRLPECQAGAIRTHQGAAQQMLHTWSARARPGSRSMSAAATTSGRMGDKPLAAHFTAQATSMASGLLSQTDRGTREPMAICVLGYASPVTKDGMN